jgi:hypothetical protein
MCVTQILGFDKDPGKLERSIFQWPFQPPQRKTTFDVRIDFGDSGQRSYKRQRR